MEIENWCSGKGNVIAIFDVYCGPNSMIRYRNLKLIKAKNGNAFIAYPSFSIEHFDGKKEWIPYFSFSKEKTIEFEKKVREALQPFIEKYYHELRFQYA